MFQSSLGMDSSIHATHAPRTCFFAKSHVYTMRTHQKYVFGEQFSIGYVANFGKLQLRLVLIGCSHVTTVADEVILRHTSDGWIAAGKKT